MTPEQYWDGDATLTRAYRKAHELRMEQANQQLWLQGFYVYQAIARLSPILHAFAKKGAKAEPYLDAPIPVTRQEVSRKAEDKEKAAFNKGLEKFKALINSQKQSGKAERGDAGE